MKKFLIIVLAVMALVVFPINAMATDDAEEDPGKDPGMDYTYITYTTIDFDISGSGYADMYASMGASASVDSTRISAYLQQYDSGWQTVQHYSKNSDSNYVSWGAGRYVSSGYQYRLLVYYYAYVGGSSESTSRTQTDSY